MQYITPETVEKLNACPGQVQLFKEFLEEKGWSKAKPTTYNLKQARKYGLNVVWAIEHGLVPRKAALNNSKWAYYYAKYVDKEPRDDTRKAACGDPYWAYWYAKFVDKGPHKDTRKAACGDPEWAYWYAKYVDRQPRDDTRKAACGDPEWAYKYDFM